MVGADVGATVGAAVGSEVSRVGGSVGETLGGFVSAKLHLWPEYGLAHPAVQVYPRRQSQLYSTLVSSSTEKHILPGPLSQGWLRPLQPLKLVGENVGCTVGDADGAVVGCAVGAVVGETVGCTVGDTVG